MSRQRPNGDTRIDRLPPHSPECEQALLGCIMLDPQAVLPAVVDKLTSQEEAFYDVRHQNIFRTMVELWDDQEPVELISLQERLRVFQLLEQVGGVAYLATLADAAPSAANYEYYLQIVLEKHALRRMIRTCTDVVGQIYESEGDADQILDDAERQVLQSADARVQHTSPTARELVAEAVRTIEEYHQNQGQLTGIGTGFNDFDRLTMGMHGGEMIVIAARPSLGKTSLALNITDHVAVNMNIPVGVFSLEMTSAALMMRLLCSRARVNLHMVSGGRLDEHRDFPRITGASARISQAPIHIDDTSGLSILQLRAKARRMHQRFGVRLFVIDYLQLLHSTSRKADNRQQEISDISCGIKGLAKELNAPVFVLAQLNRDVEREKNRKPRLSDLRESGSIEQDADTVGLLYRQKVQDEEEDDTADAVQINLLIAKQRNGPAGIDIPLTFLKSFTRFESAARIQDVDVPEDHQQQTMPYE